MLTGQNKINLILDHVGIKAPTFAKHVGVKYQRILDIQNGKVKNISAEVASRIIDAYPQFNIEWLLTGEGEMLKNAVEVATSGHRIRYWVDVDATAGGVTQFDDMMSSQYIDLAIPEFRDCTDAVNLYGDSMFPLYKSGSIIILKERKVNRFWSMKVATSIKLLSSLTRLPTRLLK